MGGDLVPRVLAASGTLGTGLALGREGCGWSGEGGDVSDDVHRCSSRDIFLFLFVLRIDREESRGENEEGEIKMGIDAVSVTSRRSSMQAGCPRRLE